MTPRMDRVHAPASLEQAIKQLPVHKPETDKYIAQPQWEEISLSDDEDWDKVGEYEEDWEEIQYRGLS